MARYMDRAIPYYGTLVLSQFVAVCVAAAAHVCVRSEMPILLSFRKYISLSIVYRFFPLHGQIASPTLHSNLH